MKKIILFLSLAAVVILTGCSGSDTYRGKWKALNADGEKFDINFDAKSFTVKDSSGKTETYKYKQNSINIKNSVETYGILVEGQAFQITFPIGNDESKGIILNAAGRPKYTIGRNGYVRLEDF